MTEPDFGNIINAPTTMGTLANKADNYDQTCQSSTGNDMAYSLKLPVPLLFNLYTNPRDDEDKVSVESWIVAPVLKMVGAFEESLKTYRLIAMDTPDPYRPPTDRR